MAYKVSSGNRKLGDIQFEEDTDTGIDFASNKVALEADGHERVVAEATAVFLKASSSLGGATDRIIADSIGVQVHGSYRVNMTEPPSYPYTVVESDHYIAVDSTSIRTINIPQVASGASDVGRILVIFDNRGQANTNNITISPGAHRKIAGQSNYVIDTQGGAVTLMCTAGGDVGGGAEGGWSIINKNA